MVTGTFVAGLVVNVLVADMVVLVLVAGRGEVVLMSKTHPASNSAYSQLQRGIRQGTKKCGVTFFLFLVTHHTSI